MVQEQFHFHRSDEFILYPKRIHQEERNAQEAFVWVHPTDPERRKYLTDEEHNVLPLQLVHNVKGTQYNLNTGEVLPSGLGIVARSDTWEVERFKQHVLPRGFDLSAYPNTDDIPKSFYIEEWVEAEPVPPTTDLQLADILRWERVVDAVESIDGPIQQPEIFHHDHQQVRYLDQHFHEAFTRSAGNFQYTGDSQVDPDQVLYFIFKSPILLSTLLVLPGVYGAIHFLASNSHFPTQIEQLLWKIASVDIIVTMPVFFILTYIGATVSSLFFSYDSLGDNAWATIYKLPGHLMLFGYIIARSYLVVESFASLRAVPIGTYWTPSWLQMIPHV
jgi:hypothetical protein